MAYEYDDVFKACKDILNKNISNSEVTADDLSKLQNKAKQLTKAAFENKNLGLPVYNIAVKEMSDFVSSMSRFYDVYQDDRSAYYSDAKNFYNKQLDLMQQQKSIYTQFYNMKKD